MEIEGSARLAHYTTLPACISPDMEVKSSPSASPITLGLLADRFDEPYQQAILRTIEGAAQQRGANLLAFAGGIPGSTVRGSDMRSLMFDLVTSRTVDGVILLAGTMVNQLGIEGLSTMLERMSGLPVCAIAVEVPGAPSIVVDNEAGVKQVMRHLVEHHGAKRFGFVRGPVRNKEAEARFAAFEAAMERAGIAVDPRYVHGGDFLRASGFKAVDDWLETGDAKELPDAILCANDEMAIGVLRALVRRGIRVPEDTRVVGFDGIDVARLSNPPLTTVRQPLEDLAMMAVRTLMDSIHGRKVSPLQTLETHLVVRESCGCQLQLTSTGQSQFAEEAADASSASSSPEGFAAAFQRFRQPLQAELARVARGEFSGFPGWDSNLLSTFSDQVTGKNTAFVQGLGQLVGQVYSKGLDVNRFQDIITAFRRFALSCCGDDHKLRTHAENVLQEARLVVAHATERSQAERGIELERFALLLSDINAALTRTYDLDELCKAACTVLPKLGIQTFYLCGYDADAEVPEGQLPQRARLLAGFDVALDIYVDSPAEATFPTADLLPAKLKAGGETRQLSVLPLFLKGRSLGYCVVQVRGVRSAVLESVREHLSVALFGARLEANRDE